MRLGEVSERSETPKSNFARRPKAVNVVVIDTYQKNDQKTLTLYIDPPFFS